MEIIDDFTPPKKKLFLLGDLPDLHCFRISYNPENIWFKCGVQNDKRFKGSYRRFQCVNLSTGLVSTHDESSEITPLKVKITVEGMDPNIPSRDR